MFEKLICKVRGHDWKFAYNYGIPLGSTEPLDETLRKFKTGEYYGVNRCTRCKIYGSTLDGLNPYTVIWDFLNKK